MTKTTRWDPELAPFVEALASLLPLPMHQMEPAALRTLLAASNPPNPSARPPFLDVSDRRICVEGRMTGLRVYRPAAIGRTGALLFFHGGGWTVGSVDSYDLITAEIAAKAGCVVVSVDYSLAPEHPYPAAMQDAVGASDWLQANLESLDIDPARVTVGGDSAGGQIAAGLCLWLRDHRGHIPFNGLWLLYPALDVDFSRPSQIGNADAPILPRDTLLWFWDNYLPTGLIDPPSYATPLRAGTITGMPPAFISVAGCDPLHDEGQEFASRLRALGIPVDLRDSPALVHGHIRARTISSAARAEFEAACQWLLRVAGTASSA